MGFLQHRVARIGGIVGMLAAMFVVHQFVTGGPLFSGPSASSQIDEMAGGDQPMSPLYAALRQEFPADYDRFKRHVTGVQRNGGETAQVTAAGHQWMRRFTISLARDFAQAPRAALFEVRDDNIALVEALAAKSTSLCAQYGMTGLLPSTRLTDAHMRLLAETGAAHIRAAAAGRKSPTLRSEPTEADGRELVEQLERAGLKQYEIEPIFNGSIERYSDRYQCKASVALFTSLGKVSVDASERLSAKILRPTE